MPLKTATVWGQETADAIQTVGVTAGTPVTPAQLAEVWKKIKEVSVESLGQGDVAPGSFTAPPGTGGGPVTGVGGPVT